MTADIGERKAGTATSQSRTPIVEFASLVGDASLCEREPIHIPGAIQPHGALLAAPIDGLRVSHASENLGAILGLPATRALGGPLAQAVGAAACRALQDSGSNEVYGIGSAHRMQRPGGGTLSLHLYRSALHFCVDIEPIQVDPAREASSFASASAVLQSFSRARSREELADLAVRGLKAVTGFDRVMAYRFDKDGHGEVIAEDREAGMEPYLGHHYPASDIPAQARRLYLRQPVGAIADSSYLPAQLLVDALLDDGAPLDLTQSTLRSASPIHRQFMRNMKTAASLTIGLALEQDLWGMLVCHHQTPRIAGPEVRAVAGMIGQVVSLLLASIGRTEVLAQRRERKSILDALVARLALSASPADALRAAEGDLLGLVNAAGALVRSSGVSFRIGLLPSTTTAERTLAKLRASAGGHVLAVDDLSLHHPELADGAGEGSGALLLPLTTDPNDAIVWFRPEIVRDVVWAGNPGEHGIADPITGRLSPRASFAAWKGTLRGRSAPWTDADLSLAGELGNVVAAEASQRARAAERASEARFRLLAEHSGDVIMLNDVDGTRLYVSPAAERVLGWRPDQMIGRNAMEFVHPMDRPLLRDAIAAIQAGALESSTYYRHRRPDGSWLWVEGRARASGEAEGTKHSVVVLRDATASKAAERKLQVALKVMEQQAATDELTGLANRRLFGDVAAREWRLCTRDEHPLSVLLLDADRFKLFNDRYGHPAGDDCLRAIASQLTAAARRPGDLAARHGGEEFVLLLPRTDHVGALRVANRVGELVRNLGIVHEGNTGHGVVTVSIGVATAWPGDPASALASMSATLSAADAALYRAKSEGRNRVQRRYAERRASQPFIATRMISSKLKAGISRTRQAESAQVVAACRRYA